MKFDVKGPDWQPPQSLIEVFAVLVSGLIFYMYWRGIVNAMLVPFHRWFR